MLFELGIGVAIAAVTSLIACRALIASGPLDVPVHDRHEHDEPTPTAGGVGVSVGFGIALVLLFVVSTHWRAEVAAPGVRLLLITAAYAYAFLVLGFLDDARPLGPRLKIAVFIALALAAAWSIGPVIEMPVTERLVFDIAYPAALAGTALWIFTFINSVNFMDGANGLAMGSMAIALFVLGAIAYTGGSPSGVALGACGAGALLGFLYWNFPRGKLFAGDAGALFIGTIGAVGSILVIHRTSLSPFVPPILFFPLLADALLTLAYRVASGHKVLEGHSEHIYQIGLRAGWSHTRVAIAYWIAMAACGVIGFTVAQLGGAAPPVALAVLALISLLIAVWARRHVLKTGI
ncbi:glycosyltransferase family 4 protein [Terricaulis sp.]|uniref:glycosyltransferase family 4 protein n=1 Tax=Terricaulis sp. TaxID=2768686 RepID=UPI00378459F9